LAALAFAAVCAVVCPGCVTLAPENSNVAPVAKTLHIQVDKAVPKVIETVLFTQGNPIEFRVNGALLQLNVSQPLSYLWLADYDAGAGQPLYQATVPNCIFAESSCKVDFCTLVATTENVHRVRLVVADSRLKSTAVSALDFPAGTVFDSIEWTVKIPAGCK